MPLNTLDTATLLQRQAAAIQAAVPQPLNLQAGSVLLAFIESNAQVAMWLQSLVMQELTSARLSTASGADVDSFVADYGLTRLAAVPAQGAVAFSRNNTTPTASIPAGSIVQTSDGTQSFQVIADTSQSAWNAAQNAYVIPSGTRSITATVLALNPGTQGNVLANTITVIAQPIQGVQYVTNALPFSNGVGAETDSALRARFALYLT
ncbi:MAG: baseplate J/gp47 family protein, partial [Burkholderiales bacterium]|nr:baseplate J/gp47 family protein [Burkholderiales bacterium]